MSESIINETKIRGGNKEHNSMLYAKTVNNKTRDLVLAKRFPTRWKDYRESWDSNVINESDFTPFPLCYEIQLMDACNMRCAICHKRKRSGKKLDMRILEKALIEGAEYGLPAVQFGLDSEALYDVNYLINAIELVKQHGVMDIIVDTNGLLLNEDVAEKLLHSGITMICISIDAYTVETYNKIRHSDKFTLVEQNVMRLCDLRKASDTFLPQIRVSFCKTYVNQHEESAFVNKWSKIVDQVDVQNYISTVGEFQCLEKGRKIKTDFCKDPFRRVGILATGDVQPCCCSFLSPDIVLGNLTKSTIMELWNSEKLRDMRFAFVNDRSKLPNYCKICLDSRYQF